MRACACCEREKKKKKKIAEWKQRGHVSITNILVYTPAVDKHLLCLACRPLQPQNAWLILAFMLMQHLVMWEQGSISIDSPWQSFIAACLWPYGPRQNYCRTVHKLLSLCQEPRLHIQAVCAHVHTRQGDVRNPWSESHRRCEVCLGMCVWVCVCGWTQCVSVLLWFAYFACGRKCQHVITVILYVEKLVLGDKTKHLHHYIWFADFL